MVTKKAQIKIQQMAFMLIAITILFILVGLFALSTSFSGLKESAKELEEKNALLLVSQLASYPELSCENAYGTDRVNCVDFDKAYILKKHKEYQKFLGIKNIQIKKLNSEQKVKCDDSNYPNCNYLTIFENNSDGDDKSIFISLCRIDSFEGSLYNKCELAKLIVRF